MKIFNYSDARNGLKGLIDSVVDDCDYALISRRDADDAVIMSHDTFKALMETVHLLKSPANAAHLDKSIREHKRGRVQRREITDD